MSPPRTLPHASNTRIANILLYALLSLLVPQCLAITDDRACYDASNKVTTHRPCISSATKAISHCCSTVDTCLGDTLCLSQYGTLYVGSCTIKDWSGGGSGLGDCPKYCRTDGLDIGLCDNAGYGWDFCCGALKGNTNCCNGTRFKILNATNQYLDQRPFLNDKASASGSPSGSAASASAAAPTSSSSTAGSNQCPAPASKNNTGAQIGLGVSLGVALLIALGFLFVENRKRRTAEARLAPVAYAQHTAGFDGGYVEAHEVDGVKYRGEMPSPAPVHELAAKSQGDPHR